MNEFANLIYGKSAAQKAEMLKAAREYLCHKEDYELCIFCGKIVTDLVCDAVIGFEWTATGEIRGEKYRAIGSDSTLLTCDLPVCEDCRSLGSSIIFCGEEGSIFTPDLCPLHAQARAIQEDDADHRTPIITKEEAEAWRRRTRMLIEAGRIDEAMPRPERVEKVSSEVSGSNAEGPKRIK